MPSWSTCLSGGEPGRSLGIRTGKGRQRRPGALRTARGACGPGDDLERGSLRRRRVRVNRCRSARVPGALRPGRPPRRRMVFEPGSSSATPGKRPRSAINQVRQKRGSTACHNCSCASFAADGLRLLPALGASYLYRRSFQVVVDGYSGGLYGKAPSICSGRRPGPDGLEAIMAIDVPALILRQQRQQRRCCVGALPVRTGDYGRRLPRLPPRRAVRIP
jgi:hypothetical protein